MAGSCGSFLWSDNSLVWVKQIKIWTGDPSAPMSWMNTDWRGLADKRTEGQEEIRPDFLPWESLVRVSGGQPSQKSRNEGLAQTKPGILNSHNGRWIKLESRSSLRRDWGLLLIRLKPRGSKASCIMHVYYSYHHRHLIKVILQDEVYSSSQTLWFQLRGWTGGGKNRVHEGFSLEEFLLSNEMENSKNFSFKLHSNIYLNFCLTI